MKHSIKHYIFKAKYVIAIVVFGLVITFVGDGSLINRFAQQQEISRLQGEINEHVRRFNADKAKLNRLESDIDEVRSVARERYFMKTDNEDIFVIEDVE